ncbi:MAG: DNA/RNA nuclease SfsA [Methanomicrobiales archaeon]|nr:DNA/RNA nuclease SfsA [Methanomicrobiales archaeon]
MRFRGRLVKGIFLERPNRFLGIVRTPSGEAECFVPNSGRLTELLAPGAPVYLRKNVSPGRKTRWDLVLACRGSVLVSVDTRAVNRLVPEAIRLGTIPSLRGLEPVRAEFPFRGSRLDFLMRDGEQQVLLEAKSCTLVEDGVALFPDAPTARGRRHLETLGQATLAGMGAMVTFVIQREDAEIFSPNDSTDPGFCRAFRRALAAGVTACAFTCRVRKSGVTPRREIPVAIP